MTITEAIEKAIEGGYKGGNIWGVEDGFYILRNENGDRYGRLSIYEMLLDPNFWKCLGKAIGWSIYAVCAHDGKSQCSEENHFSGYMGEWKYKWHCFIDHLAEGGTIDSYFENL